MRRVHTSVSESIREAPLATRCCHLVKDLTNFTDDRLTNEQRDKRTSASHKPRALASEGLRTNNQVTLVIIIAIGSSCATPFDTRHRLTFTDHRRVFEIKTRTALWPTVLSWNRFVEVLQVMA